MQDSITIIIPTLTNTKGLNYLLKVLAKYPVVVVDNSPSPIKARESKQDNKHIYLPQSTNQGFARAVNIGFTHAKTEWICILNDDIEFGDTLPFEELIKFATSNNWDAISPLLTKKSEEVENIGYRVLPLGRTELVFDTSSHLDGLTAACLVIKSEVFQKLGGFDGRFFAYLEDVDLFLRLKRVGYHFGVADHVKVIHNHMTTSSKMNNFKSVMDLKNWIFVIAKNWTWHDLLTNLPAILVERLRNLSGFFKSTWRSFGYRSLYIIPRDLLWITKELIIFPLTVNSSTDTLKLD